MYLGELKSNIPWLYTMYIPLSQEARAFYRNAEKSREGLCPHRGLQRKKEHSWALLLEREL